MASYFKSSLTAKTKNGRSKIPYTPVPRGATAACWKVAVIDPQDQGSGNLWWQRMPLAKTFTW